MHSKLLAQKLKMIKETEVKIMCITEYDEAKVLAAQKAEGATEGKLELLIGLVKDKLLSFSEAANRVNMSVSEFEKRTGLKAANYS